MTSVWHFFLYRHSGCSWLQAAPLQPFLIPRPRWQAPGEWKPAAFLGLLSLKQWAKRGLGSSEALPTGLCPVTRHGDAECSPRCQGTGTKSVSWQGQNNISVNQGNASLQDPVCAQSLQGFKTERINCWKQSSSGVTKPREIAEPEMFKAGSVVGVLMAYTCPGSVYLFLILVLLSVKLLSSVV